PIDVGIICPYNRQVRGWNEALLEFPELKGVSVYTADSLQGWEKDFIWFDTTVGASVGQRFAFLGDKRRLCVSLTRHKKGLVLLGD
ncbi:AAA domain-containing protein, partial [Hyaloscypha finlandica]